MKRFLSLTTYTIPLVIGLATDVHAQNTYVPPAPPPAYLPWGGYRESALTGAANVINATGDLYVQQEQARIQREKANQAKLDTKKQAFDEMMYEKANTPFFTEDQETVDAMVLRRLINNPSQWEITSGYALNKITPYINSLASRGVMGPAVPVDPQQLNLMNIRVGKDTKSDLGAFKNGGHLDWPLVLQGPLQMKVDAVLPQAVSQATTGTLDFKTYKQIKSDVGKISDDLSAQFRAEKIDGGEYLTGKRFLESVSNAVETLGKPGAKKVLDGSLRPKGRSVPEVAYSMMTQGLQFANATPGAEAPYYAMHSAFVGYVRSAQSSHGFQVTDTGPAGKRKPFVPGAIPSSP